MNARVDDTKRQWAAAAAGAAIVMIALAAFFSLSTPPVTVPAPAAPVVRKAVELSRTTNEDRLLAEEAALRDLTPLFLPTERNVAPKKLEVREPGDRFLDVQAPQFLFSGGTPPITQALPPTATLSGKPVAAARPMDVFGSDAPPVPLFGFGRREAATATATERGAVIEIIFLASGRRLEMPPLPAAARPPSDQPWQPFEFLVAVDPAGLIERPTLITSSRVPEVDQHFQNYLVRELRIGDRLAPGFYRITIGP